MDISYEGIWGYHLLVVAYMVMAALAWNLKAWFKHVDAEPHPVYLGIESRVFFNADH